MKTRQWKKANDTNRYQDNNLLFAVRVMQFQIDIFVTIFGLNLVDCDDEWMLNINKSSMRNITSFDAALFLLIFFLPSVLTLSFPLASQPDSSYQTGVNVIVNSNFISTAEVVFAIPYVSVMTTSSLNATLAIYGINYFTVNTAFGWKLFVGSVTSSNVLIHLAVFATASPIYYLKLCYLISSKPDLDIAYIQYNINAASQEIANYALDSGTCTSSINCRVFSATQTYTSKSNPFVVTFLSGFRVPSFGAATALSYFGLTLSAQSPGTSSFTLRAKVYGLAHVTYLSYYYLSYDSIIFDVLYTSAVMSGTSSIGCYYPSNSCGGMSPTTNFNTGTTETLSYNDNMFYMGISSMIIYYTGAITYKGEFDITTVTQNSDSTIKVDVGFSGNALQRYQVSYSYFTLQYLYCPPGGPDYYFVNGQQKCNNTCNAGISQFVGIGGLCQPCGAQCYKCVGGAGYCTACYNSQNRVLLGNLCICDQPGGFYDDGTSLVCPQCHYSCLTCKGLTSAHCDTCDPISKRTKIAAVAPLTGTCSCITGYYDSGVRICVACHYTCQTASCSGSSSTSCTTCNSAKMRGPLYNSNTCPCTAGYYDNSTSSEQCSLCHLSCLTCSGSNIYCTSCDPTKYRTINNGAHTCPCMGGYYDNNVTLCVACDSTCLTCSGPLAINCLTCDPAAKRTKIVTSCPCMVQFYDLNKVCTACYYSCYSCTDNTATGCITCDSASRRIFNASAGTCYCESGYVDMGSMPCQQCSAACLTCNITTFTCTSCHSNPGRYQAGSNCLCNPGYADATQNGFCTLCHYSCLTCSNGTATTCLTCQTGRVLSSSSCLCPTGQYNNGYSPTCQTCNSYCLNCTNGLSSGCTACSGLYFRTLSPTPTGNCICQGGYYQIGVLLCSQCDAKCLTCISNSITCSSCDSVTNHRTITSSFTCICMVGYFETGAPVCSACIATCYSCINLSSTCTACNPDRYLLNGVCYCNPGTYPNSANSACLPCAPSCLTCSTSSTTCLTCPMFANRNQFGTTCPCNNGFYDNSVTVCQPCSYKCLTCQSLTVCYNCPPNSHRTLNMAGGCPCDNGYFDNFNVACAICSPFCLTCTTYSQCLSCTPTDNRQWNSGALSCDCLSAFYENGVNTTCSPCHYSCLTCNAGLSTNCLTCATLRVFTMPYSCPCGSSFYQAGGACSPCSISCVTCNGTSTNCTSCPPTSYLSNYQCICLQGYFQNSLICSPCDVRCQWCSVTSTNCLTCNPIHGTTLNGSSCICNNNQFQNTATLVCTTCNPYCLSCISSTNTSCTDCYANMSRILDPITKSCNCKAGFYDSGMLICSPCVSPCLSCRGGSILNCTSCISGYNLVGSSCVQSVLCSNFYFNGACVNVCPNTTYTLANTCQTCINNCLTCASASLCTSCLINFYLNNTSCLALCPAKTYFNNNNRSCNTCPPQCSQCSLRYSSVICSSCNTNYYLLNNQCINMANCPTTNKTYVLINNLCKPCLTGCATCSNLTVNGCLTCSTAYSYYQGMCLSKCPQQYYSLNQQCIICKNNCTSCNTTGCLTCSPGMYVSQQLQCVPIGYFLNQGSFAKCHPNCLTCTDSSFSSCILCVQYRGDSSSKAISGYCDCWKRSIDLGNGICDTEAYKPIQKANQALVSATTSLNYLSALTGVICVNYFAPVMIASYQQLYSNFYYLNSSSVLQTDQVLNSYGDTSFNKLMEKQTNKNVKKHSKAFNRRLQATTQQQQSLFMRGFSWRYLVDWGFYTFLCIIVAWIIVLILSLVFWKVKACKDKESLPYRIFNGVLIMFKENIIIVIHLLTINDVIFYGLASFKLLPKINKPIDPFLLTFSIIMFAYYIFYLLRLFIASIRYVGSQQEQNKFMVLFSCFYSHKKKQVLSRIYIPMMMLRTFIISIALVFIAYAPIGQIVTDLLVFIVFTVYSFIFCPYYFYLKVFVHIFQGIFIIQLLLLSISVAQPDSSRIGPAFGLIFLNYLQLLNFLILTIAIVLNKIYDVKCWQLKEKRVLPFKKESQNEEAHVPVYKQHYPIQIHEQTKDQMSIDDNLDQKMDNDILSALQKRPYRHPIQPKHQSFKLNQSTSSIKKSPSDINRRRRRTKQPKQQQIDIFSLQDMDQSPKKEERTNLGQTQRRR